MPRFWVQDYFKHLLIDSAEAWVQGKSKTAATTRSEVVKAVSEQIETAIMERNEPVPAGLEKVCLNQYSQCHAHDPPF
jgi:hypothetical protein